MRDNADRKSGDSEIMEGRKAEAGSSSSSRTNPLEAKDAPDGSANTRQTALAAQMAINQEKKKAILALPPEERKVAMRALRKEIWEAAQRITAAEEESKRADNDKPKRSNARKQRSDALKEEFAAARAATRQRLQAEADAKTEALVAKHEARRQRWAELQAKKEADSQAAEAQRQADKIARAEASAELDARLKSEQIERTRQYEEKRKAKLEAAERERIERAAQRDAEDAERARLRNEKQAERAAKRAAESAAAKELEKRLGQKIADEWFGTYKVAIYANCFVDMGAGPEKLIHIQGNADISKKNALSRAAVSGAMLSMSMLPLNLWAPNRKGDLMLSVGTDKGARVLHTKLPSDSDLRALRKLEAAGMSVLAMQDHQMSGNHSDNQVQALASELKNLHELFQTGILSEEEFTAAKARLLGT